MSHRDIYIPITERANFDESMDSILLSNGFKYYDDWEYGPQDGFESHDHFTIKLMRHDFGYWIILDQHASGERRCMNLGSFNTSKEIIELRNILDKLW